MNYPMTTGMMPGMGAMGMGAMGMGAMGMGGMGAMGMGGMGAGAGGVQGLMMNRRLRWIQFKQFLIVSVIVIILCLVSYYVSTVIMKNMEGKRDNPWLIEGIKDARRNLTIPQASDEFNGVPILRSKNQDDGIEFTYSIWFLVNDWHYKFGEWKHVFHKGNRTSWPNRAPGVWLHKEKNDLRVYMNVHNKVAEYVDIHDIPIGKWIHLVVSVRGKFLDIYINGELVKRHELSGIPKQNFNNVYVTNFGGFGGYIGRFRYFNKAIDAHEIHTLAKDLPTLAKIEIRGDNPPYLSHRWNN